MLNNFLRPILIGVLCFVCGACSSLGERLASPDAARSAAALKKFSGMTYPGQEEVIGASLSDLNSSVPACRRVAVAALVKIGSRAVPGLVAVVKGTDTVAASAGISVLGGMGGEAYSAVPELVAVMNGARPELAAVAEDAIVKIGAPAVQALIGNFESSNFVVQQRCSRVIFRIGGRAARALGEGILTANKRIRTKLYLLLLSIGDGASIEDALPSIISAFSSPDQDNKFLWALVDKIGAPAVPWLVSNLKNEGLHTRRISMDILTRAVYRFNCPLEDFVSELLAVAEEDPDETIRRDANSLLERDPKAWAKSVSIVKRREADARRKP